jgi:hypothetical protein
MELRRNEWALPLAALAITERAISRERDRQNRPRNSGGASCVVFRLHSRYNTARYSIRRGVRSMKKNAQEQAVLRLARSWPTG